MGRIGDRLLWTYLAVAALMWLIWCEVFITDDSYFYLVIARNIALHGEHSFSRVIPTNGFHPLWGYLLSAFDYVVALASPGFLDRLVTYVPLAYAVLTAGVIQLSKFSRNLGAVRIVAVAIPLVFLTYLGVLFSEAHLSFLCLAWLCNRATRPTGNDNRDSIVVGIAAGLCFLARLDTAFTVGAILVWYAIHRRSVRTTLSAFAVCAVVVASYLASNLYWFDGLMPVSGWMKSTFPTLEFKGFVADRLASSLFGYSIFFGIGPILAGATVAAWIRPSLSSTKSILYPLGLGSLGHFAYIALFTRGHTDPYWYYVQPVLFVAIALGVMAGMHLSIRKWGERASLGLMLITLVLLVVVRPRSIDETRQFVPEALAYLERNKIHDSTILASDCPGKLAFHTDNGVFAVDMLTAGREFHRRMTESGNALTYIRQAAADAGRPLTHVFYMGNIRLLPSEDRRSLSYFDPRSPQPKLIGRLEVADGLSPPEVVGSIIIWRLQ